jgi:hypothetical protein
MRECLVVREVVDSHELDVGDTLLLGGAEDLAADAAETVDADTYQENLLTTGRHLRRRDGGAATACAAGV